MQKVNQILIKICNISLALMCLISFAVVILRFVFGLGWVWLQESILYFHAIVFLFASSWTLHKNRHVRVDLIYSKLTDRKKKNIDAIGALLFGLPTAITLLWVSTPYVLDSWKWLEKSADSGGLPFVYILKSFISIFCLILLSQIIASQVWTPVSQFFIKRLMK